MGAISSVKMRVACHGRCPTILRIRAINHVPFPLSSDCCTRTARQRGSIMRSPYRTHLRGARKSYTGSTRCPSRRQAGGKGSFFIIRSESVTRRDNWAYSYIWTRAGGNIRQWLPRNGALIRSTSMRVMNIRRTSPVKIVGKHSPLFQGTW